MSNKNNNVLYTGITSNLEKRVHEHKAKLIKGFTRKYNVTKLVYFEEADDPESAMKREKQIKGLLRSKKNKPVEAINPSWNDLLE